MHQYEVFVFIICLAAAFSYINHRFIRWTPTIGIMSMSLVASVLLAASIEILPGYSATLINIITSIDFHRLLIDGMLGFMLFAGSIHIKAGELRNQLVPVIALSTVGVVISTFLIGSLLFWLLGAFHLDIQYIYCLLFAALISPTDPIAVLSILKQSGLKKSMELKIAGESLFNDGVAVVVFLTILEVAQKGAGNFSGGDVAILLLREAGGGLLFGAALGYLGYYLVRSIDKYEVEVLMSIALVMGGYLLANKIGTSGPLAMVVAGIITGNKTRNDALSETNRYHFNKFWELVDEVFNAILFLLMGFEMLIVKMNSLIITIAIVCIFLVLLARWVSVALPVMVLKARIKFERHAIAILTWGGLRGGLSIALALSLPAGSYKDLFVAITYAVVIFSIIVQGLTIGPVYKWLNRSKQPNL
jgi:CPA1 family monovalent cation:H+ antiporter